MPSTALFQGSNLHWFTDHAHSKQVRRLVGHRGMKNLSHRRRRFLIEMNGVPRERSRRNRTKGRIRFGIQYSGWHQWPHFRVQEVRNTPDWVPEHEDCEFAHGWKRVVVIQAEGIPQVVRPYGIG